MGLFKTVATPFNALMAPLVKRGFSAGGMTIVTYVGRRSGKTFSTPIAAAVKGDTAEITVMLPDQKQWWRNFEGEGHDLSLLLDGTERAGHGVARRDGKTVKIDVQLR